MLRNLKGGSGTGVHGCLARGLGGRAENRGNVKCETRSFLNACCGGLRGRRGGHV